MGHVSFANYESVESFLADGFDRALKSDATSLVVISSRKVGETPVVMSLGFGETT